MAEGVGINGVQSNLPGASTSSQAAESASKLPKAPGTERAQQTATNATQATTFSGDPAVATQVHSKVVSRLLAQNAIVHSPGLARIPLPGRAEGEQIAQPKKPAGPMGPARDLQAGHSPLAPTSMFDASASMAALGELPGGAIGHDAEAFWNGRLDALEQHLGGSA